MPDVLDLWTGFSSLGTPTPVLSSTGVLTMSSDGSSSPRFRRTVYSAGGMQGKFIFWARAISGTGLAFAEFSGTGQSNLAGEIVIEGDTLRRYEMPVNLPATADFSTLTYGFSFYSGRFGSIEVRQPVMAINTGVVTATQLVQGSRTLGFDTAGKVVVGGDGTGYSDGSASRSFQIHGTSSGTTNQTIGIWSEGTGGPLLSFAKSASPTVGQHAPVVAGADCGAIQGKASNGVDFQTVAQVLFEATSDVAQGGSVPGRVAITAANASGALSNVMEGDGLGNVILGTATTYQPNTTQGFVFIPSVAGAPTGVPAQAPTNRRAMVWDRSNKRLCVFDNGVWYAMQGTPL